VRGASARDDAGRLVQLSYRVLTLMALFALLLVGCDSSRLDADIAALKARVDTLEKGRNPSWVLWAHWSGGMVRTPSGSLYNPYTYQIVQAYTSKENCDAALSQTTLNPGYDRMICLPEAVKPQ
jgi:hypothetical protein